MSRTAPTKAPPPDLQVDWVDVDDLAIRVARSAVPVTEEGHRRTPLLIFNGIGANLELLRPVMEALDCRQVIAFDAPGAGGSETPRRPYRPSHVARLATGILDELGSRGEVDVIGVSWGGGVAQQFAYQHPERCRKLILAATSPGHLMVPGHPRVLLEMASPFRYLSKGRMIKVAQTVYGGLLRDDPHLARTHATRMRPPSLKGYWFQLASIFGWSSLPWLHRIEQPTLVMAGDDDPIVPLINGRILAALIPNARLHVMECGHLFLLTRLDESVEVVRQFLDEA